MPDSPPAAKQQQQQQQGSKPRPAGGKISAMGQQVPEMRGSVGGAGGHGQQDQELDLDD